MITKEQLSLSIPGILQVNLDKYYSHLCDTMTKYGILSPLRQASFISQVAHESNKFTAVVENLNYSAEGLLRIFAKYFNSDQAKTYARKPELIANRVYANRLGNKDEKSGDGWKNRGRGLIQVTGADNIAAFDKAVEANGAIITNPSLIEQPHYATLSAGWFWDMKKLNLVADTGNNKLVSFKVNGGYNGLEERMKYYDLAKKALGI